MDFSPILRFAVVSDIHYKAGQMTEVERFERGMDFLYSYASSCEYKAVDALYVVGDFANRGEEPEMLQFKASLEKVIDRNTVVNLSMASHEFMSAGEEGAHEKFARIFGQTPDTHRVINGFHFISLTTERGCRILEEKQSWLSAEMKKAAEEDFRKPIFVFQHPHLSDTVYGSINWGEDDIISILADYPQTVDFSGHSHAPINDPRSVHQRHFSCFGTGSFSYFELDEFDKIYGTVPPDANLCGQFLIVEVDAENRVRVIPVDALTCHFFNDGALIGVPSDPDTFTYTDRRYKEAGTPVFPDSAVVGARYADGKLFVSFPQAKDGEERVDGYVITVRENGSGRILARKAFFSSYYLYDMPQEMKAEFSIDLPAGEYILEVVANGFWKNDSEKLIKELTI